MTIHQLIRELQAYPPDLRVMVDGYEGGYDDLEAKCLSVCDVRLDVHEAWYYGRHEEAFERDKREDSPTVSALILRRPWHDH